MSGGRDSASLEGAEYFVHAFNFEIMDKLLQELW